MPRSRPSTSATKVTTEATSNASGDYVLPALQPGTYSLTVEATGFRKARIDGIELAAASNVSQAVTLEVGQLTEVVEVTANTVNVQTSDSQVANSVTIKDIETLPQLARTPITLAIFQPGVQVNPQANGTSSGADYSFAHVNGLRQGSNNNTPRRHRRQRFGGAAHRAVADREQHRFGGGGPRRHRRRQGRVRPQRRRAGAAGYPLRHQPVPRQRVRLPPQPRSQRQRFLR